MPGIVVGVDNSTHSQRALDWAVAEAGIRHVPLTVVAVQQVLSGRIVRTAPEAEDNALAEHIGRAVREQVDATLDKAAEPKPEAVEVKALAGSPAEEILKAAKDAEMIVLGSRGAGGFAKLMLGSVSSQVTHHAHCPVIIIPPEDRRPH